MVKDLLIMQVGILDRFDRTSDDWMWLKIKDPWNPRGYQPDSPVVADWVTRPTNQVTGPTDRPTDWLSVLVWFIAPYNIYVQYHSHDCQISNEKHKIRLSKSPSIRQPWPRWSHFMTFAGLISRWITLIHRQGTVGSKTQGSINGVDALAACDWSFQC